ncbi:MAG: tetraacyldisaccharide 4'-kinase [Magnetococcales bacterium]|nr:tetraacyldisaccharide 4'-kinase [Magnetococcales bacterium]
MRQPHLPDITHTPLPTRSNMVRIHDLLPLLDGSRTDISPRERILLHLLRPFGWAYGSVQTLRTLCHARQWLPTYRPPVPVISVGNLTSGGTGKTPMVAWLARQLLAMGCHPVLVSRGYGQLSRAPVTVVADARGLHALPPPGRRRSRPPGPTTPRHRGFDRSGSRSPHTPCPAPPPLRHHPHG